MVKVCNFSFFDEQRILSPKTGEPLAIACSDKYLFVAAEGCVLEVYPLTSTDSIAQLRTVSPVVQLVYNARGDCIVTLERKNPTSRMFARVYFKWQESTIDRPMRVSLISSLTQGLLSSGQSVSAEINELPADETMSVNCVAVCRDSGRIAVGMDSRIRVFTLKPDQESGRGTSYNIEILLDLETGVPVKKVDIFNDFIAFISPCEARVLKLSLLNEVPSTLTTCAVESEASSTLTGWESSDQTTFVQPPPAQVQLIDRAKESKIKTDDNFVTWSPSKVWEDERVSSGSNNSLSASSNVSQDLEPHPLYDRLRQPRGASPHIETLALPSITMATRERTKEQHPVEVLGPVEYVWGQPVEVRLEETTPNTHCRVLTMLYRRFSPSQVEPEQVLRRMTMSLSASDCGSGREEWGMHTVELIPIRVEDSQNVIGVSCFIGSRLHGYLYDVAVKARLISSFSFTSDTISVASDGMFFYALSQDSVETFSNRAMQVALFNRPSKESEHAKWLKQPCPNPNMDLTLMASSKLLGGCCIATSRNFVVVLTKSGEPQPSTGTWLFQSLRRPTAEPTWNIYILLKKDPLPLYHQFVEYADIIRETSLAMYQHVIGEGHVLLRNQLLQNPSLSVSVRRELDKTLADNCFSLADSLCSDIRGPKVVSTIAAKYFLLSGASIAKVVQHITTQYPQTKSLPYQILLKYLSLALSGADIRAQLEPISHTVLDLFAQYKPQQLSYILLNSPLGQLAPDRGLTLLSDHLKGLPNSQELFKGQLCQVILLLGIDRAEEAQGIIRQLPENFLVEWLKNNMLLVIDPHTQELTPLGKLLWSQWEGALLELLDQGISSGQLSLDGLLTLLKVSDKALADNTLLKGLLERIILNNEEESIRLAAALPLVDLLLARLVATHSPRPPFSTPFSLYGNRHKWLDSLPPFNGSMDSQTPTQTVLQDLMQLQALLCSTSLLPVEQVARRTLDTLGESIVPGQLSLKLLTWPQLDKLSEAVELALNNAPQVTVEFCLVYLPSELKSWKDLLSLLLETLIQSPHSLTHQALYKAALKHMVSMTTPEEFLGLLPTTGSLKFFFPFIESSLQQYVATQLGEQLNSNTFR